MAQSVIRLRDVSVFFGKEPVLQNVNLSLEQGESLVVIGPSGHGKTILLKTIAGLIEPTSGEVEVCGQSWQNMNRVDRESILAKLGMLFQKNALFDSLSIFDNIAFPLREKTKLTEAEIKERVENYLDAVGILHAAQLFPDEISGGMQKRLGIARALSLEPSMILYDDPTAGLDPITSLKIIELILRLKEKGNTSIITVTNDMSRARQLAGQVVMAVDREVIPTGSYSETLNHQDPRVHQFVRGLLEGPLMVVS